MNAYAETTASASFNIAYNSLERRFTERGTADSVRRLAAEQEENEIKTAALAPEAYRLGARKECRDWNSRYKTGASEDGFYMTVSDYKRCFYDGMGYDPQVKVARRVRAVGGEWHPEHPAAAYEFRDSTSRALTESGERRMTPAEAYRDAAIERWFPREEIAPIKDRRLRSFPVGAVALVILFALVLALPITLSVMIKERSDAVAAAEARLAELDAEVASLENSLSVKDDLAEIRRIAVDEYGMISTNVSTTHYLALGGKDRIEAFSEDSGNTGVMALLSALGIRRSE